MKKFTSVFVVATLAVCSPALAEVNTTSVATTSNELAFAFDGADNLQAVAMTDEQMADTEGAWVANAVGGVMGGIGGHYGYLASSVASGTYNRRAHAAAVVTGAGVGALSPVRGATTLVSGMRGVAIGTAVGGINGYAGATGTTLRIR